MVKAHVIRTFFPQLSKEFSKDEVIFFTSQIRRVVDSISLNISEGAIVQYWNIRNFRIYNMFMS
ncbi:MAG: four helix bundle protein [Paludibacteraceae bacterium]|nr:four helix bundle protein [Paludibacteraceae bacterium]